MLGFSLATERPGAHRPRAARRAMYPRRPRRVASERGRHGGELKKKGGGGCSAPRTEGGAGTLRAEPPHILPGHGRNKLRPSPSSFGPERNVPAPPSARGVRTETFPSTHAPIRHGSTPDARRMETSICFAMLVAGQDEAYDLIHTATLFRANEPLSANETPPTPFVNRR